MEKFGQKVQQENSLPQQKLASFCCGKILVNKKSLVLYNLVDEDQKKRSRLCEIKQLIKNTWISA